MLRVIWLILLGLIAYVCSVVWLFPAAPVVERFKPQIRNVEIAGVDGRLFKGTANQVRYTDDLLPLQATNVQWRMMPRKLFAAAAGVGFSFDAYGGAGEGEFSRTFSGDMALNDFVFDGPAKKLEPLLPLPIAEFDGQLNARFNEVTIENELLRSLEGAVKWSDARLQAPVPAFLGVVDITIEPAGDNRHRGIINASGGEVEVTGSVEIAMNGDFQSNVLFTPTDEASPELINAIRSFARPERDGRFRFQRNGNVNRLM